MRLINIGRLVCLSFLLVAAAWRVYQSISLGPYTVILESLSSYQVASRLIRKSTWNTLCILGVTMVDED